MSEYGYIGKDAPTQAVLSNSGVFSVNEHKDLLDQDKILSPGQLDLIQTQTISGVSTADFSDLGDYNVHLLTVNDGTVSDSDMGIAFRLYENDVLESGSVYETARQIVNTGGNSENKSTSNSALRWADNIDISSHARGSVNGYLYFYNLLDNTKFSFVTQHSTAWNNSNIYTTFFGSQLLPQASYVNKIQVMAYNTGTITGGTFSLYGIKEY